MSVKGLPYPRFRRVLETGRLTVVLTEARELRHIDVDDGLEVLILMAREHHPAFNRAATRWVGRLLAERPSAWLTRYALALVERLPDGATGTDVESLRLLARRL